MVLRIRHILSELLIFLFRLFPVRNRVFFYTIRSNEIPLDNLKCVYDALDCNKVLFACTLPHSFKQMMRARYYLQTSRVIVTDDYIRYLRQLRLHPGQKVVQLWHAAGAFKRFGLDAPSRLSLEEERRTHDQYTDVIVSCEGVRQFYAGAFGVSPEIIRPLGVPRTDLMLQPNRIEEARTRVFSVHPALKDKTLYLYAPTFRETDGTVSAFDPQIDFNVMSAALREDEAFVICRHPVMTAPLIRSSYSNISDLSDISTLDLLAVSAVLITDYSSLIFDAALLKKPMLFYCPDLDRYERSFYLRVPQDLPGEVLTKPEGLLSAMRRAKESNGADVSAFIQSQLECCDGHATQRVASLIQNYLK